MPCCCYWPPGWTLDLQVATYFDANLLMWHFKSAFACTSAYKKQWQSKRLGWIERNTFQINYYYYHLKAILIPLCSFQHLYFSFRFQHMNIEVDISFLTWQAMLRRGYILAIQSVISRLSQYVLVDTEMFYSQNNVVSSNFTEHTGCISTPDGVLSWDPVNFCNLQSIDEIFSITIAASLMEGRCHTDWDLLLFSSVSIVNLSATYLLSLYLGHNMYKGV